MCLHQTFPHCTHCIKKSNVFASNIPTLQTLHQKKQCVCIKHSHIAHIASKNAMCLHQTIPTLQLDSLVPGLFVTRLKNTRTDNKLRGQMSLQGMVELVDNGGVVDAVVVAVAVLPLKVGQHHHRYVRHGLQAQIVNIR